MKKWKWAILLLSLLLIVLVFVLPPLSRKYLTRLALAKASETIGAPVAISRAELDLLHGGISVHQLKIFHPLRKKEVFASVERLSLRLPLLPLLKGEKGTLAISMVQPLIHYRTNAQGNWELKNRLFPAKKGSSQKELPFHIVHIAMQGGTVFYHDGKMGKTITLSPLNLKIKNLYSIFIQATVDQKARLQIQGGGNLMAEKISFQAEAKLENLPLIPYAPYYEDPTFPMEITNGIVTLTGQASCQKNYLKAPLHARISNLELKPKKNVLLGAATERFLKELKDQEGNLELDFLVEGNLENPQFHLTTNLSKALGKAMAKTLIKEVPKTVEKVKEIEKEVRSTIESIKKGDIQKGIEGGIEKLKDIFGQ